jgi:alpha-beta hydrolase superfamily lysophospholipase
MSIDAHIVYQAQPEEKPIKSANFVSTMGANCSLEFYNGGLRFTIEGYHATFNKEDAQEVVKFMNNMIDQLK